MNSAVYKKEHLKEKCKHPQVRVQGINRRTHHKFDILCDNKIAELVYTLNTGGVRTCYSCQGDVVLDKDGNETITRNGAYIVISVSSPKYLAWAHGIITRHFWRYYIYTETDSQGRITYYTYNSKRSIYALADLREQHIKDSLIENMEEAERHYGKDVLDYTQEKLAILNGKYDI